MHVTAENKVEVQQTPQTPHINTRQGRGSGTWAVDFRAVADADDTDADGQMKERDAIAKQPSVGLTNRPMHQAREW